MKKITLFNLCGHRFLGVNESGEKVMVDGDQPATGMRPMELLLTALSSCTAYDVIDIM
jgi:putative redox protein